MIKVQGNPASIAQPIKQAVQSSQSGGESFGSMLRGALQEVNQMQNDSRQLQNQVMEGKEVDIDQLMVTMEQASVAMQLTLQVRNKLLEAYQEVNRMQI